MLSAGCSALAAGAIVVVFAASPALADGGQGPVQVHGDYRSGTVTTHVQSPGSDGSGGQVVSTGSSGVTCRWKPDGIDNAAVLGGESASDAADTANRGGRFYTVTCSDGRVYLGVFVPGSTATAAAPTPASLARQAVNRMRLPDPEVRHNPPGSSLVNLATWWWVDRSQWHPLSQRTAAGPVWARVTVTPVRSVWDAGDGTPALTCDSGGTPYDSSKPPESQSTECSHTYTNSSAGQAQTGPDANDRSFTVTATVYWRVEWVGPGGVRGSLPLMARSTRFPLRVEERQTVVTGGWG